MSRRSSEGGRNKSLLDPRRYVKCPVSECELSGRINHVKRHFSKLIVWSKTYVGEAAEEREIELTLASVKVKTFYKKNKPSAFGPLVMLKHCANQVTLRLCMIDLEAG